MRRIGILLAAGASRRFGPEDKLLAPLRGEALVLHAVRALQTLRLDRLVAITSSPAVEAVLAPLMECHAIEAEQPLSASFLAALALAAGDAGFFADGGKLLIALGDMPGITATSLQSLLALPGSGAASFGGVRMPPVVLDPADMAMAREGVAGDRGARGFLASLPETALVPLTAAEAQDVDRPEDLARCG